MNTSNTNQNPTASVIAVVEMLLLFIVGILGNKIAEILNISPGILILLTIIGLGSLAAISYSKSVNITANQPHPRFSHYLPKTMISMLPFGIILGLLAGLFVPSFFPPQQFQPFVNPYEVIGIFLGLIFIIIIAIAIDNRLAASIGLGYGIAFATVILVTRPRENEIFSTYGGFLLGFVIIAIILVVAEPVFKWLQKIANEPRIQ